MGASVYDFRPKIKEWKNIFPYAFIGIMKMPKKHKDKRVHCYAHISDGHLYRQ